MPRIARVTGLPAGDTNAVEAVGRTTLRRIVTRGRLRAARRADALEALALTTIGGCEARPAVAGTGAARAVDALGGAIQAATLGGSGAGTTRRLALAKTIDACADAAIRVSGAGSPVRSAGIRQHCSAGRARRIAGISEATLVVALAGVRIGALGTCRLISGQERTKAGGKCLQDTAARGP